MKFWLYTVLNLVLLVVWEEIFVPIKPYLHLERVRCGAHAFAIDFGLREPVLLQCYSTRLQFGTNFTTDRKKIWVLRIIFGLFCTLKLI